MLGYGIVNKDGYLGVDQKEQLLLFRTKKSIKKSWLNKGEKIQVFEVGEPLDGRKR